jgi:replicative DNA helicase
VIGSVLIRPDALLEVCDTLAVEDFWCAHTRIAYKAALEILKRGDAIDRVSLFGEVERLGGSVADVTGCVHATPTAAHIQTHAAEVKRLASCRRGIALAGEMAGEFYDKKANPAEVVGRVGTKLLGLIDREARRNPDPRDIILRLKAQDVNDGLKLGSGQINYLTGGLQPREFWVIGAFSSTGKTALALQWLREALDAGGNAAYFSLEMSQEQIMLRLVANYAGVPMHAIRYRTENREQREDRMYAEDKLAGMAGRFWLYDDVYTADEICYIARKHKLQKGLDVVFVDYLQNLKGQGERKDVIGAAANAFLELAKNLGCCVVALSQVTTGEARLKDEDVYTFKDSGAIRDLADKAFMLRRDRNAEINLQVGKLTVDLKKNRTWGLLGKVEMGFEFATGRIWEIPNVGQSS